MLDSAHDTYDIRLLNMDEVKPFIELNKRGKKYILQEVSINQDGIPVCPANLQMICWGYIWSANGSSGAAPCMKN